MKQSQEQRQVNRSAIDTGIEDTDSSRSDGYHYLKNHGYSIEEFAQEDEVTQFNGIRVIDPSDYEQWTEFENFNELHESDWEINPVSAARLSNGAILYEGRQ